MVDFNVEFENAQGEYEERLVSIPKRLNARTGRLARKKFEEHTRLKISDDGDEFISDSPLSLFEDVAFVIAKEVLSGSGVDIKTLSFDTSTRLVDFYKSDFVSLGKKKD